MQEESAVAATTGLTARPPAPRICPLTRRMYDMVIKVHIPAFTSVAIVELRSVMWK